MGKCPKCGEVVDILSGDGFDKSNDDICAEECGSVIIQRKNNDSARS